ncbi:MAG: NAD-dependent epimerase/dehydratase family protein [Anaerolineae bacterium]|nr:NAD-dependent epimerase/dehydratase family protein [Anaerolineae bacterium]
MRVMITGATSSMGQGLARHLLAQGHAVTLLARDPAPLRRLGQQGARLVQADLRDRLAVMAACVGQDMVVHAGALSAAWGRRADFFAVNVGGVEAVLAGCRRHGVRRLVYVSSPSVVFDGRDVVLGTEAMPYAARPLSVYALTKRLGEDLVNAARPDLETVILRPKAVFGPGDRALLPRLLDAARRGRLVIPGDGQNQLDLTYVDNVVHALALALEAPNAVGGVYTITNAEHPRLWDVIRHVLARLGLAPRLPHIPLPLALALAHTQEGLAALTGREPTLTRYTVLLLAQTQTYDITAARRDLGYQPVVPLADGVERTLAALTFQSSIFNP